MKVDTAGRTWITTSELKELRYAGHVPEMEQFRRYYGKTINTAVIEQVLQNAACGYLRDLSDLGAEAIRTDPHLASIVPKRMRAVSAVKPRVVPVQGDGIKPELAKFFADMVQRQLEGIPRIRQRQVNLAWSAWGARAALEIQWVETNDPKERWRAINLHWIHPRRIVLGPEREMRLFDGLYQGGQFQPVGLDMRELPFKFLTSQRQLFNEYPEREGLVIPALFFAYFKRFTWRERLALLELYGKPHRWVEVMPDAVVDTDALEEAKDTADNMGSDTAAVMPKGLKLMMEALATGSSAIHKEILTDCDAGLSKLILGSTNTTESQPSGLGSGQAYVHQDGETLVFTTDCEEQAGDWTEGFAYNIVMLNAGPDIAEVYTPRIELPYEPPPDPDKVLGRAKALFDVGLGVRKSELYKNAGFTQPTDEDITNGDVVTKAPEAPVDPLAGLYSAPQKAAPPAVVAPKPTFSAWRRGRTTLLTGHVLLEDVSVQGIPVTIDRPIGFRQSGADANGVPWTRTYTCDYGFIPNTAGGDGEALDVFLGKNLLSETVFWVKQKKADGAFDEFKLFIGFDSATEALDVYGAHIPTQFFSSIQSMPIGQVKALLGIDPVTRLTGNPLELERATRVLGLIHLLGDEVGG